MLSVLVCVHKKANAVYCCHFFVILRLVLAEPQAPRIQSISLTSNNPTANSLTARAGTELILDFTVADDFELPTGSSDWVSANIVVPGNPAATFVSMDPASGSSRTFRYRWTVPSGVPLSYTTVGYAISVTDVGGFSRTITTGGIVTLGTWEALKIMFATHDHRLQPAHTSLYSHSIRYHRPVHYAQQLDQQHSYQSWCSIGRARWIGCDAGISSHR